MRRAWGAFLRRTVWPRVPGLRGDIAFFAAGIMALALEQCGKVEWLDRVVAWGMHADPLRKAVIGLKYQGNLAMGDALCQLVI